MTCLLFLTFFSFSQFAMHFGVYLFGTISVLRFISLRKPFLHMRLRYIFYALLLDFVISTGSSFWSLLYIRRQFSMAIMRKASVLTSIAHLCFIAGTLIVNMLAYKELMNKTLGVTDRIKKRAGVVNTRQLEIIELSDNASEQNQTFSQVKDKQNTEFIKECVTSSGESISANLRQNTTIVKQPANRLPPNNGHSNITIEQQSSLRKKRQAVKTLIIITVVCFICQTPYVAVNVLAATGRWRNMSMRALGSLLALCNSGLNALIYMLRSKKIRKVFKCH